MFRRSGSVVSWYVAGSMPDPTSEAFTAALGSHRFRSIEHAASEELSVGWVSPSDPTGESFDTEAMDLDLGVWLRFRVDRKALPAAWIAIHRAEAERAAGRPLSARERRDLRSQVTSELLPRVLPTVKLVDALWEPRRELVLLFGTSKALREEFHKLFFKTFAADLVEADPLGLATRLGLDQAAVGYLSEVAPVPWPRAGATPHPSATPRSTPIAVEEAVG